MLCVMDRALLVDPDADLRAVVARALKEHGFDVTEAADVESGLAALDHSPLEVAIVEPALAGVEGFDVLRRFRQASDAPLIVLSARHSEADRITGLDLGADDYVVKPCSIGELMARVRAVRRRRPSGPEGGLRFDDLLIDRRTREVAIGSVRVSLTHREFDLLAFLAESPGQVFSREQLLEQVWGSSSDWQDPKTITEHIRRLRLKLEVGPHPTQWIRTVHGVGYAFTPGEGD